MLTSEGDSDEEITTTCVGYAKKYFPRHIKSNCGVVE